MFEVFWPFILKFPNVSKFYYIVQPEMQFKKVVFPQPEGPKIAVDVFG